MDNSGCIAGRLKRINKQVATMRCHIVGLIATNVYVGTPVFSNEQYYVERLDRRVFDPVQDCISKALRGLIVFIKKGLQYLRLFPTYPKVTETFDYLLLLLREDDAVVLVFFFFF